MSNSGSCMHYDQTLFPGIVDFQGSTMVTCPTELRTGIDLVISLCVRLKAAAFKKLRSSATDSHKKAMFDQGKETPEEQTLRERKKALIRLFKALALTPSRGNDPSKLRLPVEDEPDDKSAKKDVKGDGEEDESEGEELNEDELNLIYKRCALEVSPTFF